MIVDLTLAECRGKGKSRFQLLGLKADDQQSLKEIIKHLWSQATDSCRRSIGKGL